MLLSLVAVSAAGQSRVSEEEVRYAPSLLPTVTVIRIMEPESELLTLCFICWFFSRILGRATSWRRIVYFYCYIGYSIRRERSVETETFPIGFYSCQSLALNQATTNLN